MAVSEATIKVSNYAEVPRDGGLGFGDCIEEVSVPPCAPRLGILPVAIPFPREKLYL
jgi:hypothetical protein